MSEWRPIETAPRDGTDVLCTYVHRLPDGRLEWYGRCYVLCYRANWNGSGKGAWVLDDDWAANFQPSGYHDDPPVEYGEPTHWMPLPAPPVTHNDAFKRDAPQGAASRGTEG